MSTIIFSHGKESGPNGTKIQKLTKVAKNQGFKVISIDYRACKNASERVLLLKDSITSMGKELPLILVGSSMGGYVSTVVASEIGVMGLFLMCPALYLPNYEIQSYRPKTADIEIIHGWQDEIVPFENSIQFAKQTKARLHLVNDNHRLSESHNFLEQTFEAFLEQV